MQITQKMLGGTGLGRQTQEGAHHDTKTTDTKIATTDRTAVAQEQTIRNAVVPQVSAVKQRI